MIAFTEDCSGIYWAIVEYYPDLQMLLFPYGNVACKIIDNTKLSKASKRIYGQTRMHSFVVTFSRRLDKEKTKQERKPFHIKIL